MSDLLKKFTSRKFLVAVSLVIIGAIAIFTGATEDQVGEWQQWALKIIGVIAAGGGGIAYIFGEAKVDAARESGG